MAGSFLETPIEYLKGVGPKRAELLKEQINIHTFGDLLYHFPFRYIDRSRFYKISELTEELPYVQLKGVISNFQMIGGGRSKRLTAVLTDDTGQIELVWFKGAKWILDSLVSGMEYVVFGKPAIFNRKFNIAHPETETVAEFSKGIARTLEGIYSTTEKLKSKGLNNRNLVKLLKTLVTQMPGKVPETLSQDILNKLSLMSLEESLLSIHFPSDARELQRAQARLKFEELFFIQLKLLKQKMDRQEQMEGNVFESVGSYTNEFYKNHLPFELTNAQKRVIREIRRDLGSGKQMNRLLQGDVGSGKTLVALMTMLIALDNGFQACLMAPTEILANQHFNTISKFLQNMDLKVELLTGSTRTAKRKKIHEALLSGELPILVGTHALLEESVVFKNLGMVVIDEQHRFGVAQRARLWQKNLVPPHILVMTATPIPRTLAMTVYGDLDLSVIDEMPPGRKQIKTYHYYDSARLRLFGFMKKKIREGSQIDIVYPLIQESEKLDLKHLMDGYESITRDFPLPQYAVSIVHGKMRSADKDYEMKRFLNKETQIMVATTVIEVGVDVPNASVMVIENAERFGLSQLHQLRGRVGRGADQSYCILMTSDNLGIEAQKRISIMVRTTDGFEIAEADLQLRGPGDLQGTQQSGMIDLKLANLVKDEKILQYARSLAREVLEEDQQLVMSKNKPMERQVRRLFGELVDWGKIS